MSERKNRKKSAKRTVGGSMRPNEAVESSPSNVTIDRGRSCSASSPSQGCAATDEEIALEAARCRKLQRAVDVTVALIHQSHDLSLGDMIEIVQHTRSIALELFPGRGETFDLLYRPRLIRAINERFGIEASPD